MYVTASKLDDTPCVNNLLFQSELSASTAELMTVIGGEEEKRQELEAGDLMSFAQQIASGMVSEEVKLDICTKKSH